MGYVLREDNVGGGKRAKCSSKVMCYLLVPVVEASNDVGNL